MTDLKKMSMSELIAKHNELANMLGVSEETSFKNLAAARNAVANLESKMNDATNTPNDVPFDGGSESTQSDGTATAPAVSTDKGKYNSSGKRGPTQGVGEYAKQLIQEGMDNATVLAAVLDKFPSAKTSKGCIAFYRTALSKGPVVKTADPAALRAKAQALLEQAMAAEAAAAMPAHVVEEATV